MIQKHFQKNSPKALASTEDCPYLSASSLRNTANTAANTAGRVVKSLVEKLLATFHQKDFLKKTADAG
ncbi:hypothetical protein RSSM_05712 [Rhodopirellula sallentina SM41]|uniref:Uncharacterized protein n=1 Tax=Rhodopirellula sallentina SM41 TaxID=1263870 RepID=M5TUH8_9BACT|nr:hypothetical protein RSSM_05712 [Rhodopirellula sallentina SM41]